MPAWQVAVPAVIGGVILLAALFAAVKLAPGIMDDLALMRMQGLKSRFVFQRFAAWWGVLSRYGVQNYPV